MPYIADLYHDTEYDMCRESDRMQRPKITGTDGTKIDGRATTTTGKDGTYFVGRA